MRAAAALACFVMLAGVARAERDKHAATSHFQQGSSLYADGRWADALAEFQAGYDAYPLRGFLVNIGQCYRKLDRLEEAADTWRRYLATHPADSRLRAEVEDALAEVDALLAKKKSDEPPPKLDAPAESVAPAVPSESSPAALSPALAAELTAPAPAEKPKKSKRWVWAVVSVALVSVAAAAVTVGVVEWQATTTHPGSLGTIDGRR